MQGVINGGKKRLELAVYLRDNILNKIDNKWFIENGTLLGAWCYGKFIEHDDDFDIGMLINCKSEISKIYKIIEGLLKSKYKARLVSDYAMKIEVYDEKYGKYVLGGEKYNRSDFHYVTLDIQFYVKNNNLYKCLYFIKPKIRVIDKDILVPISNIILEGEKINSPRDVKEFLKKCYGSLDKNAKYNTNTGLYE